MKPVKYKYLFCIIYSFFLIGLTGYLLLDTFVIEKRYVTIEEENSETLLIDSQVEKDSYSDENINIKINEYFEYNTRIYVAEIKLKDAKYLKTAFAQNTYGRNVVQRTSQIAKKNNAILAINGDYYGAREKGLVMRNGVVYRTEANLNHEALGIFKDGRLEFFLEDTANINELVNEGIYNIFSFGPGLIKNHKIIISPETEVDRARVSNPRTAIAQIDDLHYLFVVSDGRNQESEGLTLYELATFIETLGVLTAYNLDGGGSTTMYFNGKIINKPTTNAILKIERGVSDIVYIGY